MRSTGIRAMARVGIGVLCCATTVLPVVAVSRNDEPVVLQGTVLEEMDGREFARMGLFRWNPGTSAFEPVPFQLDAVIDEVFNPGTAAEFTQRMYDVLNEDDELMDDNDELAFLFGDAGPQAPAGAAWPTEAQCVRYEIQIVDARPGFPTETRWAYLFTGQGLPQSGVTHVVWDHAQTTGIFADVFSLRYLDRWLLTELRIPPPCGTGDDLIDRVKGRAGIAPHMAETEQIWNQFSTYLGGMAGPIRAIRYVRGAASGVNTIHNDVIYRAFWERRVNLRVHNLSDIWFYFDWLPRPNTQHYSDLVPAGVPVDGVNDGSVPSTPAAWSVVRSPAGGIAVVYDVPPSQFLGSRSFYWKDDASYNDAGGAPGYTDEDNSAYGNHGYNLHQIDGNQQQTDTIPFSILVYPLCSNEGDASTGQLVQSFRAHPLQVQATPQSIPLTAIRTLLAAHNGPDLVLAWEAIAGAASYRVYAADFADLPAASWTVAGETATASFTVPGGALPGAVQFYTVVGLSGAGQEGPR